MLSLDFDTWIFKSFTEAASKTELTKIPFLDPLRSNSVKIIKGCFLQKELLQYKVILYLNILGNLWV